MLLWVFLTPINVLEVVTDVLQSAFWNFLGVLSPINLLDVGTDVLSPIDLLGIIIDVLTPINLLDGVLMC